MRSRILLIIALLTLLLMWATAPAAALTTTVLSFSVTCEEFVVSHSDLIFDRDNQGTGAELYSGFITDGNGDFLEFVEDGGVVGTVMPAGTIVVPLNPAAITANPVRFRLVSEAGNGLPEQVIWDLYGDCDLLPPSIPPTTPPPPPPTLPPPGNAAQGGSSFTGAGIPAGFVMHTITCTTPVYTDPAGVPVGEDRVLVGQTWYVDPDPVEGADGQQWTEIFVGSAINPWIPTECVG